MVRLVRFDPFREIDALQRQLMGDDWTSARGVSLPTTDIYTDKDSNLVVEAHLPNYSENDVDVSIDEGALVIQAEKHEKEEDKKRKYVVRESSSSFYRRIELPERADADNIDAEFENGVLKVKVPMVGLPEPKKIQIGKGGKKEVKK